MSDVRKDAPQADRRKWSDEEWEAYYAQTADEHNRVVQELQGPQSEAHHEALRHYSSKE